jgi:hypothetical protein
MPEPLGKLTIAGHTLPIREAYFEFVAQKTSWVFQIEADGPPELLAEMNADVDREWDDMQHLVCDGAEFYADADPIPLENKRDLVGTELVLIPPYDQETGEIYFSLYLGEHNNVSQLTLRFTERIGERYKMTISALVHDVSEELLPFEIDTWIDRRPDR